PTPSTAVSTGRSWNATAIGSRKNTGSRAAVAPPETRHSTATTSTSMPVDAQSAQRGRVGLRDTSTSQITAATAQVPSTTTYTSGSQWSTSQIHTRIATSM